MKIDQDVLIVLEAAEATPAGIKLTGQLDRKLYERVNKVLTATGWKWNKSAKAHTHPDADPAEALESLLSTGEVIDAKKQHGFFETTGDALERVIELADIQPGVSILEPSAGGGNIVRACIEAGADEDLIVVCEVQEPLRDALNKTLSVYAEPDFLLIAPDPDYKRVVMNPPFGRQADLDHVLHAVDFLAPGGRLVAVMSAGVRFRTNRKTLDFHQRIKPLNPRWEDLPEGSFKDVGTNVNTCILVLDKAA